VDRPAGAVAVMLLAGTFTVQTHLGTAPVVLAAWVVGVVGAALGRRRFEGGRSLIGPAIVAGVVALAWLPPLFEQLTHNPGNAGRLVSFFTSGSGAEPTPGLKHQLAFAGRELAAVPGGIVFQGSLTPATVSTGGGVAVFVVFVVAAGLLIFLGHRLGNVLARQLGVVSLVAALAAAFAVGGIRGEVFWYLTAWMSAVTVPLFLGFLLLVPWRERVIVGVVVGVGLVASVVAIWKPLYDNRAFPNEANYRNEVRAVWADVAPTLKGRDHRLLLSGDLDVFAPLDGVADRAARKGWHVHVSKNLEPYYGREFAARGGAPVSIFITRSGTPPPGAVLLGESLGIRTYRYPSIFGL
jgi:hypothetical protein